MSMMKTNMLVRSLSTSGATAQLVKAPLQLFGLEGRYASALYSAASKQKALESVEKELTDFQKKMKSDTKLKEFIVDPSLKRSLKVDALKYLSSQIKLSPTTGNLLGLMAENGRLGNLEAVINAFKLIMAAHRGEVACEVTTARPLDAAQKQSLEEALKKFMKSNETLQLTAKVDPTLMGGMIVSIGDRYVDMSVASKVKKYTEIISASA